jgi:hypothetical protein
MTSLKTPKEAVLDAMQSQFYKIYCPINDKAVKVGVFYPLWSDMIKWW